MEALQWLIANGMVASTGEMGSFFITRKGREITTAERLQQYLQREHEVAVSLNASATDRIAEITGRAESDLTTVRMQAESKIAESIGEAQKRADEILKLAQKTAEGVSLKAVQDEFARAAEVCLRRIRWWATLGVASVGTLIVLITEFMNHVPSALQIGATGSANVPASSVIYQAIIRVTLLTAVGAVATFCFRVLRAQMHLREQNLHRERLANSVAAFLGAASSPEQRDVILSRLVDSITSFGNSGLLSDAEESLSPMKLVLESLPKVSPK